MGALKLLQQRQRERRAKMIKNQFDNEADLSSEAARQHKIVVVGASAGGIDCLKTLFGGLTMDCPASFFVVQHIARHSPEWLERILDEAGPLPASVAMDGEPFLAGHVYVAAPDRHLLVRKHRMISTRGPRENRARPAIDPLFRSAAVHHGPRVIGIILSGMLDDGTAGLLAIKRCGGVSIVQSPEDALYSEMPQSALDNVSVDHQVSMHEMSQLLSRLIDETAAPDVPVPRDLALEDAMAGAESGDVRRTSEIGQLSGFTCPECKGPLWQIKDETIERYRCHTGHAFTARILMSDLAEATERALWVALQTLEGRHRMLKRLAHQESRRDHHYAAGSFQSQADELEQYANSIRLLLREQLPGNER